MPCLELPSSCTTLETKRWTLSFACEKNQQLSCCWSEKFPTTSDAGLLLLEDLQPYLEYGKKAFDAIMSGCLEEITKGAIKTNGAGRKKDMEEKAAAIEGHCTFVWGNQVRCACVTGMSGFQNWLFSLHNVCENWLLITRCEIWIDLVYQFVFQCMSCFFSPITSCEIEKIVQAEDFQSSLWGGTGFLKKCQWSALVVAFPLFSFGGWNTGHGREMQYGEAKLVVIIQFVCFSLNSFCGPIVYRSP